MYKILIVEDDNSIHAMVHEYLEKNSIFALMRIQVQKQCC